MDVKTCSSLEEVRKEVDLLDAQIVELIAMRSGLIRQAARFKESVEEIKAEDRIRAVVNRVREKAIDNGVNPNMMEEIYHIMIDEMVETEVSEFRDNQKL